MTGVVRDVCRLNDDLVAAVAPDRVVKKAEPLVDGPVAGDNASEDIERLWLVSDSGEITSNYFELNIIPHVNATELIEVMSVQKSLANWGSRCEAIVHMDSLSAE